MGPGRVGLLRHGRRPAARLGHLADLGLGQQDDVLGDLAERPGHQGQPPAELDDRIPLGVPGRRRHRQIQDLGHRRLDRRAVGAEGRQGAGGTAEGQHGQPRFDLLQAIEVADQRCAPAGNLEAEGGRRRVLAPGAAGHDGVAVGVGQHAQAIGQVGDAVGEDAADLAQLQHQGGVDDVLGGRPPMDGGRSVAAHQRAQAAHQRRDRHAVFADARGQILGPDLGRLADRGDAVGRRRRDHADPPLGPGQGRFDRQPAADAGRVVEQRRRGRVAEQAGEQGGAEQRDGHRCLLRPPPAATAAPAPQRPSPAGGRSRRTNRRPG